LRSGRGRRCLWGLPEKYFTQALLWHHDGGVGFGERRDVGGEVAVPTWSWAAWKGPIAYRYDSWFFGGVERSFEASSPRHTNRIVDFYYSDPSSGVLRPVSEEAAVRDWEGYLSAPFGDASPQSREPSREGQSITRGPVNAQPTAGS